MTTTQLILLVLAAFTGGAAFGLTGFAYGVVASLFLHHAFQPGDVVFLLVGGGLLLNVSFLPKFWSEVDLRGSLPLERGEDCRHGRAEVLGHRRSQHRRALRA